MNENEEFEFRLRAEKEAAQANVDSEGSKQSTVSPEETKQDRLSRIQETRSFVAPKGPMETLQNVSQYLQREEATLANPILNEIRKRNPAFGEQPSNQSIQEAIIAGAKGETFSPFAPERQVELGDIIRQYGAPEIVAQVGGLAATEVLPSSLAMTAAGGFIGRFALKQGAKAGLKASEKAIEHADKFRNTFREIEKKTGKGMRQVAEVLESTTNIDSNEILYAFNNPQILTKEMARPELMSDYARELAEKTTKAMKNNPDSFMVNERIPLELGQSISDDFNGAIEKAGKEVGRQKEIVNQVLNSEKELTGITRGVKPSVITDTSDAFLKSRQFLDEAGNVKPAFKDSPVVRFFNEIKSKTRETTTIAEETSKILDVQGNPIVIREGSTKPLEFQDLLDFKKIIQDVAYKTGVVDSGGVMKPLPDVQAAARYLNGQINAIITDQYKDFPELIKSFQAFSSLADVRADVAKSLGSPEKLASILRRLDTKNPEQLTTLYELLQSTPGGDKYLKSVDTYLGMKKTSLSGRLPIEGSVAEIEKGLKTLLEKKPSSLTVDEAQALERLAQEVGFDLNKVIDHKVAKSFAQKSNFFRALASGSIITGAVAGGLKAGPIGAVAGAATGYAITDPRMVGAMIRSRALRAGGRTVAATGRGAFAIGKAAAIPVGRRILQEQDTRDRQ